MEETIVEAWRALQDALVALRQASAGPHQLLSDYQRLKEQAHGCAVALARVLESEGDTHE